MKVLLVRTHTERLIRDGFSALEGLQNKDGAEIEGHGVRGIFLVELFEPVYEPGHKAYAQAGFAIRDHSSPSDSRLLGEMMLESTYYTK